MFIAYVTADTIDQVVAQSKYASDRIPNAKDGDIILIALTKGSVDRKGCDGKSIKYIMRYDGYYESPDESLEIWNRKWKYIIKGKDMQAVRPFNMEDVQRREKPYTYYGNYLNVDHEDEAAVLDWISKEHTRYWIYAPGAGASHWEEDTREGIMTLGWNAVGDLRQYGSREEMKAALREREGLSGDQRNNGLALWQFLWDMKPGDIVYAKQGYHSAIGRGIVDSEYDYIDTRDSFRHVRKVCWAAFEPSDATYELPLPRKTLTEWTNYPDELKKLEALFSNHIQAKPHPVYPDELPDNSKEYREGKKKSVAINIYERNPVARQACIEHYGVKCFICGFDFGKVYGAEREGMIHVHHLKMVSEADGEYEVNPINDLRPVCPNCHMVLHSKKDGCFSIDEVKAMFANPILSAISERRSIRQYKPEQITEEQLQALLCAAVEAPSARNLQPWHFTVVQDANLLAEVNAEATAILGREGDIFYAAPTTIFISADKSSDWGKLDSGIAVQNIALAAQSMGLGSVILGLPAAAFKGPRGEYFAGLLKFPATHGFAVAIAVGYPDGTKEAHPVEDGRISYVR